MLEADTRWRIQSAKFVAWVIIWRFGRPSSAVEASVEGGESQLERTWGRRTEHGATLTLVRSTPVRALTVTGSSASRRFTSPVTRLPSPLRMTISLVLANGAATLPAIWTQADGFFEKALLNTDSSVRATAAPTPACAADLGQRLQDQGRFGGLSVLLVGLSFQPHLLSLRLPHRFDRRGLGLADEADLLGLCLGRQHRLCPRHKQRMKVGE